MNLKIFRTMLVCMLTVSAFGFVVTESYAQTRRVNTEQNKTKDNKKTSSDSQKGSSNSATRPSGSRPSREIKPTPVRPRPNGPAISSGHRPASNSATRPSGSRPSREIKPTPVRPRPNGPAISSGHRPASNSAMRPSGSRPSREIKPTPVRPRPNGPAISSGHRPASKAVHPRDRDFVKYSTPSCFWSDRHHCYGHRVRVLPRRVVKHHCHGHVYYCYDNIWYRPYRDCYVVCRPPFGTALAATVISNMAWTAVNIAYYNTVARTYSDIKANNETIARQNAAIARNNATLAAQNQAIAAGAALASQAYSKANELGLLQSYADASASYFYQDGVFYSQGNDGNYQVIVPPAGALVESLPEDYDVVTLKGNEYYKVDDTVYQVTINDGKPYFEVLGQLYD